jgi:hypothetical protein
MIGARMACVVCKNPNGNVSDTNGGAFKNVTCPTCGSYRISEEAVEVRIVETISDEDRILFSGHLKNHTSGRIQTSLLPGDIVKIPEMIAQYKKLTAMDKVQSVISFLAETSSIGAPASLNLETDYTRFYCKGVTELRHIRDYLVETGIVKIFPPLFHPVLTIDGWQKYETIKQINQHSKRVFVAMSFDKGLDAVFKSIEEACEASGDFKAYRVDLEEHDEKICDKIIAEIKSSRFVIADFTGQRHNVYYEAGFAKGMGLKVIWCCKEDEKDSLKSDIRQYNHILWKDCGDLEERLINRIQAKL